MAHEERLGAALGMHTTGGNFSFFATPLLAGGLVAVTETWRTPYLAFAVAPVLAAVLLMVASPRRHPLRHRRSLAYIALQLMKSGAVQGRVRNCRLSMLLCEAALRCEARAVDSLL